MKYIFGNWKMYLSLADSLALAQNLAPLDFNNVEVALFPTSLAFSQIKYFLQANTRIDLGAQNVAWTPQGAYTGALSAELFKEAGATHALVGHSERRYIFSETDTAVRKKIEACIAAKIIPIVCVGETREDKEKNTRIIRLKEQLKAAFENLQLNGESIFVAYEPVWAISHGNLADPCLPADVADVHAFIREELKQYTDKNIPILYGGSVNVENLVSYLSVDTVDGVLVGNASTKKEFWEYISHL